VTAIDTLLKRNDEFGREVPGYRESPRPELQISILTCMDARIRVFEIFGLLQGEAHIMRNAGGVVTDDMIRSLTISQRKLQTRDILLMQKLVPLMARIAQSMGALKVDRLTVLGKSPAWQDAGLCA
jgi:carbonic anhydrase